MVEIKKLLLRKVDVKDYCKIKITLDEVFGGPMIIWLVDTSTREYVEGIVLSEQAELLLTRIKKIDTILDTIPIPTNRDIYLTVKEFYQDFDDIYYFMLYADCK